MKTKNNAEFPTANELANKPKMPEVIYAEDNHTGHIWIINNESYRTSYTRTDKVQELKEALRGVPRSIADSAVIRRLGKGNRRFHQSLKSTEMKTEPFVIMLLVYIAVELTVAVIDLNQIVNHLHP